MDPALKNGPLPCRDEDAWRTTVKVRYPYLGVDNAEVTVEDLLPDNTKLAASFDVPEDVSIGQGMLGWDSGVEKVYRQKLQDLASEAKFFVKAGGAYKQIQNLGLQAQKWLTLIGDYYTKDARLSGQPLTQPFPTSSPLYSPGVILQRDRLRHDIVEAYQNAAQILWCADYGMAQTEAYLANREDYEAPIKPGPGGLVDPAWTNYTPIAFDESDWNIAESDLGEVDGIDTTFDPNKPQQPGQSGGGAGIAIAAVVGVGLLYMLTRK